MNFLELARIALSSLSANKLRSALTMLGIIIGVAAVIALMSIGRGAQQAVKTEMADMGTNLLWLWPEAPKKGTAQPLTYEDALALDDPQDLPAIVGVAPEVTTEGQVAYQGKNANPEIVGVTPDYQTVRNYKVQRGEFISQANITSRSSVAVIGADIASKLFSGGEDPIGQTVRINSVPFRVIGVLKAQGSGRDKKIMVPLTTAVTRLERNRSATGNVVSMISVKAADANQMDAATQQISAVLRRRHHVRYEDDFAIQSQQDWREAANRITGVMTLWLAGVAGISLLVGGIGIMNIMLVSVTERTGEIGIRKAVGATRENVLWQFLTEATILSVLGGLIGVALGVSVAHFLPGIEAETLTFHAVVAPDSILLATLFAGMIGLFSGIYPAFRAAQLNPIDALRYE